MKQWKKGKPRVSLLKHESTWRESRADNKYLPKQEVTFLSTLATAINVAVEVDKGLEKVHK